MAVQIAHAMPKPVMTPRAKVMKGRMSSGVKSRSMAIAYHPVKLRCPFDSPPLNTNTHTCVYMAHTLLGFRGTQCFD
jgi:hypothetical protein